MGNEIDRNKNTAAVWAFWGTVIAALITGIVTLIVADKFPFFTTTPTPGINTPFAATTLNSENNQLPAPSNSVIKTSIPHSVNLGEILFQEDFNGNVNQWPTGTDRGDTYYIDGGEYHVIGSEGNESGVRWLGQFKKPEQVFDDFYLETKVRFVEGSRENDSHGVLFRSKNGNPYVFVLGNAQQVYSLHTEETLLWWTYSPKIVKNGTNTIGILCEGNTITIFINGEEIDSVESDYSDSGSIGLVYAVNEHIAFDYIYVWALSQ